MWCSQSAENKLAQLVLHSLVWLIKDEGAAIILGNISALYVLQVHTEAYWTIVDTSVYTIQLHSTQLVKGELI